MAEQLSISEAKELTNNSTVISIKGSRNDEGFAKYGLG
jgi:hypothetical protein